MFKEPKNMYEVAVNELYETGDGSEPELGPLFFIMQRIYGGLSYEQQQKMSEDFSDMLSMLPASR